MRRLTLAIGVTLILVAWHPVRWQQAVYGQVRATGPSLMAVTRATGDDLRAWDQQVDQMIRVATCAFGRVRQMRSCRIASISASISITTACESPVAISPVSWRTTGRCRFSAWFTRHRFGA